MIRLPAQSRENWLWRLLKAYRATPREGESGLGSSKGVLVQGQQRHRQRGYIRERQTTSDCGMEECSMVAVEKQSGKSNCPNRKVGAPSRTTSNEGQKMNLRASYF